MTKKPTYEELDHRVKELEEDVDKLEQVGVNNAVEPQQNNNS